MRLFNTIWELHFSRRLIFLLCLATGMLASGVLLEPEKSGGSVIRVSIAPAGSAFDGYGHYQVDPADGRDLKEYFWGGWVEECTWKQGRELRRCLRIRDQARKFIYDHWRSKERAYIAIDFPCTDCFPTMHVFIEPNEAGEWRIAIVHEDARYPPRRWPDAVGLIYRKPNEDDRRYERPTRVLSFRDLSNVEIAYF